MGAHAYLFSFAASGQTPKSCATVAVMVGQSVLTVAGAPAVMLVTEARVVKVLEEWCRSAKEVGRTLLWSEGK